MVHNLRFLTLLVIFQVSFVRAKITVFESISALDSNRKLSGLHLKANKTSVSLSNFDGLTICGRFDFKSLNQARSQFISIWSPSWSVLKIEIGYQLSFFGFGNNDTHGSMPSYMLQDVEQDDNDYMIWSANKWHHMCIAYEKTQSYIRCIKVKRTMRFLILLPNMQLILYLVMLLTFRDSSYFDHYENYYRMNIQYET